MWGTLVISTLILLLLWDYINKKHRNEVLQKSQIGGVLSLPIAGSTLQWIGISSQSLIANIKQLLKENGKIYHIWFFNQLFLFCTDRNILETILTSPIHITKSIGYDMLSVWLGDGLLMSTGKKWHTRRKILTPSFHFKILNEFVDIFDRHSEGLIKQLGVRVKDSTKPVDMFPVVCLTALDIIAEAAMGVQVKAQTNPEIGYVKSVKLVTNIIAMRLRKPLWRSNTLFKLIAPKMYHQMMKHINYMQEFTKDVIEKRRQTLESLLKKPNFEDKELTGFKKNMALLDQLLLATVDGKPLTNEDIREEVETFMFEGHDTTTSGLAFALYCISRYPEVQKKLFTEIRQIIGDDKTQAVSYRQLQGLQYMECVIKESLRLYPPVPIINRYFKEDTHINDIVIPGNTHFNIPLFVVLRDPDYFKDPNDFKPERYYVENIKDIFPFAYTPFSAGPRNCIGQKFAMLEMKSVISKVLRYYELLPIGPEVEQVLSLILRSKTGTQMGFKPRAYKD